MHAASEAPAGIAFARFLLLPHRRELLADGRPVKLGGRAFDVLMALIEARGAVVSKDALMARVWPDRIVEENNLQWQISALRAALGPDRNLIRTVPGRGYQFTAEIDNAYGSSKADAGPPITAAQADPRKAPPEETIPGELPPTNVPEPISELIGRDDVLGEILSLASAHRLVTLTGAGGIGKTRLALAAARRLLPQFADGAWLAEFSPIADPGLVPVTVAAAVGLDLGGGALSAQRLSQALAGRRLVLVLDTCEHVIGAAAVLVEAVLSAGQEVRLLATSREPLRAEGEWVYPVPPLVVPAEDAEDADDLLCHGGVRLFVERLCAADPHFAPDRRSAGMLATICRRLDGIPLAIELAASRAAVLGVEEVATHLDDRFRILTGGRRTALPRHQTLRAALDWSYELLSEPERVLLRRLGIFAGAFALDAVRAVVTSPELSESEVVDGITSLIAKSLIQRGAGAIARYRLLDTMRAYALEKLVESGERNALALRHAEVGLQTLEWAEAEWEIQPTDEWLDRYAWRIDDLRAALDWTFSPEGNAPIGIAITAAAVPLWMHLSLQEECRARSEQALAALRSGSFDDRRAEMKLQAALAACLILTRGGGREIAPALTRALELAESLGDTEYQLRALCGLAFCHTYSDQHRRSLEVAQQFRRLAANRPDPNDELVGERLIGIAQHLLGDQPSTRRHTERVLEQYIESDRRSYVIRFNFDLLVGARGYHARALWLLGFPEKAMRAAERTIEDARAANHAMTISYALALAACPIALLAGDLTAAETYIDMLLDHSRRHALRFWHALGRTHQGLLAIKRGDVDRGSELLRTTLDQIGEGASFLLLSTFADVRTEAFAQAGQVSEALAATEAVIRRTERNNARWLLADVLRRKGELLLLQGGEGAPASAEEQFRQALNIAREQSALSWELRAATSLARLLRDQSRCAAALPLLQLVYDRFTEGFETADLKTARNLLTALSARQGAAAS